MTDIPVTPDVKSFLTKERRRLRVVHDPQRIKAAWHAMADVDVDREEKSRFVLTIDLVGVNYRHVFACNALGPIEAFNKYLWQIKSMDVKPARVEKIEKYDFISGEAGRTTLRQLF